jgi:hypothetical protein
MFGGVNKAASVPMSYGLAIVVWLWLNFMIQQRSLARNSPGQAGDNSRKT